jgi:hypothetical protein
MEVDSHRESRIDWFECDYLTRVICDNVVIGAGAVVTKDISKAGIYVGNPAKLIRPLKTK